MVFLFDEEDPELASIPAVYEVCETCDGRGSHVNPSIDAHGISPEEFHEDPDFAESYWRGDYDQSCNECCGQRVSPTVSPNATQKQQDYVHSRIDAHYEIEASYEAERRFGA